MFEKGSQLNERCVIAKSCGELNSDLGMSRALVQRERDRGLAGHIEEGRELFRLEYVPRPLLRAEVLILLMGGVGQRQLSARRCH